MTVSPTGETSETGGATAGGTTEGDSTGGDSTGGATDTGCSGPGCPAIDTDISGEFLLAISTVVAPDLPIQFIACLHCSGYESRSSQNLRRAWAKQCARWSFESERLASLGQGSTELMLFVNEMNEHEHVKWAQTHPPVRDHIRNRIIRPAGSPFISQPLAASWLPTFNWDIGNEINVANDDGTGPIPVSYLFPMPRHFGCFLSVRYGGSNNNGKLIIVEAVNRHAWVAESGIPDVKWSAIQYASHDDLICLDAS